MRDRLASMDHDEAFEKWWEEREMDIAFPESKGVCRSAWHAAISKPPEATPPIDIIEYPEEIHFRAGSYDTFDVSHYGKEIHFAIDEPWAGSTESGFGQHSSVTLGREQALKLAAWIQGRLTPQKGSS